MKFKLTPFFIFLVQDSGQWLTFFDHQDHFSEIHFETSKTNDQSSIEILIKINLEIKYVGHFFRKGTTDL